VSVFEILGICYDKNILLPGCKGEIVHKCVCIFLLKVYNTCRMPNWYEDVMGVYHPWET